MVPVQGLASDVPAVQRGRGPAKDAGTWPPNRRAAESLVRQRIYDIVQGRPGVGLVELGRVVGVGRSAIRYHVSRLRREQRLRLIRVGGALHAFPSRRDVDTQARSLRLRRDPSMAQLVSMLCQPRPRRLAEVVADLRRALTITDAGARKVVQRARTAGFISVHGRPKVVTLGCAPMNRT